MAITGIPIVFLLISLRLLPTPEPGWIPVSVIWIVLFRRSIFLLARASIAMTKSGFVSLIMEEIIVEVSMPVEDITPGEIADTGRIPSLTGPRLKR